MQCPRPQLHALARIFTGTQYIYDSSNYPFNYIIIIHPNISSIFQEVVTVNISKCEFTIVDDGNEDSDVDIMGNGTESSEDSQEEEAEIELDVFRDLAVSCVALNQLLSTEPAQLLQRSTEVATAARNAAKELIDYGAKQAATDTNSSGEPQPQPSLYVDGFDPEQIWLQLDMLSVPALKRVRKQLKKVERITTLVSPDVEEALDELLGGGGGDAPSSEDDEFHSAEDEEEDEDGVDYDAMLEEGRNGNRGSSSDDDDDDAEEEEELVDDDVPNTKNNNNNNKKKKKNTRMSDNEARAAVEDDFMKLDEMEAFLQQAERAAYGDDDEEENFDDIRDDGSESDIDDDALGRQEDSEDDDDDDGGDSEAEEAELEALLDNAAVIVGRKRKKQQKGKKNKRKCRVFFIRVFFKQFCSNILFSIFAVAGLDDSEDEEEEDNSDDDAPDDLADDPLANATYEDFFGPRKLPSALKKKVGGSSASKSRNVFKQRDVLAEDPSSGEEEEDDFDAEHSGDDYDQEEEELDDQEEEEEGAPTTKKLSAHQRRMERTASRIRRLEEEAMGEKPWFLQGEVVAGARPKNSALEIDLDFETTVKPPPAPTEESTRSLEDMIKARVIDGKFDDPLKMAPPGPDKKKMVVELDDKKSSTGLGELYEREYVAAVTGVVEDRDAPVRELALAQFKALSTALDSLSHGHYRPVPAIEDVTVRLDVPAIMMEEAAPAFVSTASMRAPEEIYKAGTAVAGEGAEGEQQGGRGVLMAGGGFKSEAELTREDRKRRRADKKRASKKRKAAEEEEAVVRAASRGQARVSGRKSEEEQNELRKLAKAAKKSKTVGGGGGGVSNYSRSAKVFGQLQAMQDGTATVGGDAPPKIIRASGLKL